MAKSKAVVPGTIQLVKGAKVNFRSGSARDKWYGFLASQVGSTPAEFVAAATEAAPSLQPKGKYGIANKVEPPQGWLSWFTRNGYASIA